MQLPDAFLGPSLKNNENPPKRKFLIFREMEVSCFNIKKFLIFSYISRNGNPRKNFLYFKKQNLLISQEGGKPKKLLIFQEVAFLAQKMNKTHSEENFLHFKR